MLCGLYRPLKICVHHHSALGNSCPACSTLQYHRLDALQGALQEHASIYASCFNTCKLLSRYLTLTMCLSTILSKGFKQMTKFSYIENLNGDEGEPELLYKKKKSFTTIPLTNVLKRKYNIWHIWPFLIYFFIYGIPRCPCSIAALGNNLAGVRGRKVTAAVPASWPHCQDWHPEAAAAPGTNLPFYAFTHI